MKYLLKFSLVTLITLGFFSCDLDDDDYNNSWGDCSGFGFVYLNEAAGTGYSVRMDDGSELFPDNNYSRDDLEDSDRVLVNYTITGEKQVSDNLKQYYADIVSVSKILYKGILDITPEIEDSIGNDPVHVDHVWKKDSLLTFRLEFYGNVLTHYINLVKQPGELTADDQPIQLELRHNDNNDGKIYHMSAFVTFNLSAIQIAGQDSVSYLIKGNDYGGSQFSYEGVYHY